MKLLNKRNGSKVEVKFLCGNCTKTSIKELNEVVDMLNQHRTLDDQVVIGDKMKVLLEHLEQGEVHYATVMAVPSAMRNKPIEIVTTLKTFLKGDEKLWVLCYKDKKSYVWKADYKAVAGDIPDFCIHSCDTLAIMA